MTAAGYPVTLHLVVIVLGVVAATVAVRLGRRVTSALWVTAWVVVLTFALALRAQGTP